MEALGASQVKTVIQSGNAVFDMAPAKAKSFASAVVASIAEQHGFEPKLLLLREGDLIKGMDANPYPRAVQAPKSLHLSFLEKIPKAPDREALDRLCIKSESWSLQGRWFYLHAPDGIGRSKLASRVEALLGVPATGRNWATLTKLRELMANP